MSSSELTDWIAYYNIEPFGEERADLRAGIIASTVYNVNRSKGKAMKPADFMPRFDTAKKKAVQTAEQIWSVLTSFTKDYNSWRKRNG